MLAHLQRSQQSSQNGMANFIRRHFDHNVYTNTYKCKYCGKVDNLKYIERTNNLYLHIYESHRNFMSSPANNSSSKVFFDRSKFESSTLRPSVAQQYNYYLGDKDQGMFNLKDDHDDPSQTYSDEWLDRLAISGFPIRDILVSIFSRHRENSHAYAVYLENKALRLKNSIDKIKKYLNNKIPLLAHPAEVADEIVQKFRITPHGAKLVMEDFMLIYRNDYEVTDELRRRGMTIYRYEEDRMNTVVFFCDDVMKINFSKYGDCVFANFRPCLIKRYGENRRTMIGTFTGQNTCVKHVLFGSCLVLGESAKNYKILMRYFIRAMKMPYLPPGLIITDSENLSKAIKSLIPQAKSYQPEYVVSWYHLQEQLKKKLEFADEQERDYILKKYMNVLSALKSEEIEKLLSEMNMGDMEKGGFAKVFENNKENIMAYKKPVFMGFGVQKEHGKILNQIVTKYLSEFETLGFFYIQSMKMFQHKMDVRIKEIQLIRFQEFKNFQVPLSDELRYLSIRLEKPIFMKFLAMYKIALNEIKIIAKTQDNLLFQLVQKNANATAGSKVLVYTVKFYLQQNCWKCNCGLLFWSGLPCSHLIKVIRLCRGSLTYYINRRWLIHNEKFNPNKIHHPQQAKMEPELDNDFQETFFQTKIKIEDDDKKQRETNEKKQTHYVIDDMAQDEEENMYLKEKQERDRAQRLQTLEGIQKSNGNSENNINEEKEVSQNPVKDSIEEKNNGVILQKKQKLDSKEAEWLNMDASVYKIDNHQDYNTHRALSLPLRSESSEDIQESESEQH